MAVIIQLVVHHDRRSKIIGGLAQLPIQLGGCPRDLGKLPGWEEEDDEDHDDHHLHESESEHARKIAGPPPWSERWSARTFAAECRGIRGIWFVDAAARPGLRAQDPPNLLEDLLGRPCLVGDGRAEIVAFFRLLSLRVIKLRDHLADRLDGPRNLTTPAGLFLG